MRESWSVIKYQGELWSAMGAGVRTQGFCNVPESPCLPSTALDRGELRVREASGFHLHAFVSVRCMALCLLFHILPFPWALQDLAPPNSGRCLTSADLVGIVSGLGMSASLSY